ncbi:MAG: hypothetical protein Phog2KO_06790 [Phototrophicaceae bacterium]
MTQTANESIRLRAGENPYLERTMRLLGIGISIAVTIFTLTGIFGIVTEANNNLSIDQNNGLNRVENAIQTRLDRYATDLLSLGNDPALIEHLTGAENVRMASARASDLLALRFTEYDSVQFIEIRNGEPFLAFERVNNNRNVSDVIPYQNFAYVPPEQSATAFSNVANGLTSSFALGDFYLSDEQGTSSISANTVFLDSYIPIFVNSQLRMIVNLKIDTAELQDIVNLSIGDLVDNDGDAQSRRVLWLVGTDTVIADSNPDTNYIDNLNASNGNVDGNDFYEALLDVDGLLTGTEKPITDYSQQTAYSSTNIQFGSLLNSSWRIIITDNLFQYYSLTFLRIFTMVATAVFVSITVVLIIKQILRPIFQQIYEADTLVQTAARDSNVAVRSVGDQTELVTAARRISTRMSRLSDDLKNETERHNRDMQVAGRIGRETAILSDLDTLANTTINLICNEFGFYHAQIFLLDQSRTNAVLRYSRGNAGEELIKQGHQLRVGSETVIGRVSKDKSPVIVDDTEEDDSEHGHNPLLSETRSEMGLPLLIGDTIIGVLDIQSRRPYVFMKNDLPTYQLVADQLAVGIYNAQLREQSEQRIEQIDSLNRQFTREAWQSLTDKIELRQKYGTEIDKAKLASTITLRGEVIGNFEASLPEGQEFSEADRQILQSVSERVSLALENARLFQETQTSLAETSTLYGLSRRLNEADDLEDVLEAIIVSIAPDASGGQVWLFDETTIGQETDWVRVSVDMEILKRDQNILLLDRRLQRSQYLFMEQLSIDEVQAIEDIGTVHNIAPDLRQLFLSINARAILFIPLNIRGSWKGFLSITFSEARRFAERDQQIYNALIAQVGVAIDNRLLLQQTEQSLERQERLYSASRLINTSQNLPELVTAAVSTSNNPKLDFWLALLEGEAGDDGWTDLARVIAKSKSGKVEQVNELHKVFSAENSPMRRRDPEILVDPGIDIDDVPEPVQWMRSLGYQFIAMFPLFSDNTPIALFYIVSTELYDLSQDDYEVYRALTGQMSTQIQNRNLFTQTEETLSEIRRLYVASRSISSASDIASIYDAVTGYLAVPFIRQSANSEQELNISITVLLADPQPSIDAPQLRYDYDWNSKPSYKTNNNVGQIISHEDAPIGRFIANNDDSTLVYKTIEDVPNGYPLLAEIVGASDASSAIITPLWSRAQWFGVMIIRTDQAQLLDDGFQRFAQSIADQVAIALENQLLLVETQFERQTAESLYNANTVLSRTRGYFDLFKEIDTLLDVLNPDMRAGYFLGNSTIEEMFKQGFEDSEANGLDLEQLITMPLSAQNGLYVTHMDSDIPSPYELEVLKAGNIQSFVAMNLNVNNQTRGRLLLGYKQTRKLDIADKRYLSAIADSSGVVLDNQLLLGQVQDTLQETSILYQASKALIEADTPDEIIDVITMYLIESHVTQVFIAMLNTPSWDDPSAVVRVVSNWHTENQIELLGLELSAEDFPAWPLLSAETVTMINDIYADEYALDDFTRLSIESLGMSSFVILPIRVQEREIGAIWIGSDQPYEYVSRDLRIFQSFAEQTSLALEAKRLLEQTETRARQLQASSAISQSVGQTLELDILLPQVVDLIRDQFNYDHVQVFLMDEDNEWALLRASTGQAGVDLLGIGHKLKRGSSSVIGQVTELGEPFVALDTTNAQVAHQTNPYLPKTRSEMALPMIVKGEIVGALDVQSDSPNAFNDEDVRVLTNLASQIAVAIDNARLYEDAEQSAEDMSFLFDITTTAATAETLHDALDNVAHQIMYNVRSNLVAIYLTQDYEDYYGNRRKMIEVNALASDDDIQLETISNVEIGDSERLLSQIAMNLEPQTIANMQDNKHYKPISEASQSAVLVPITSRAELIGIIALESTRLNTYTQDTIILLQTLAGSLSAIIQNTLLVEQLQQSNEQLREVDRLKSQFLASMSHELRTPLNSIIGFSRVMLKGIDGPLSEMQEQDLTTIYNSGNHLLRLINDILDQAKIEANEINLKFGYFDIKPLVESVKSIAIGLLKEKPNLQLEVDIADGLPKAYGDEFRSRQILLNLVTNAIKFTEQGTVTIRVYAIVGDPAPMLRLDVVDTGMGIAESDLGTVFEQFRQVDSSLTRTAGGTGLGLPISKSFSELQGGKLTVASELGVGSVFSVTIPTYEGAEEELDRKNEAQRSGQKAVSGATESITSSGLISKSDVEKAKKLAGISPDETAETNAIDTQEFQLKKQQSSLIDSNVTQNIPLMTQKRDVILVEDEKTMVNQFRRILQREGFEVTTADFAAFAEAMIGQLRPNVVILDVNFADGVGWDLLKNLKERDDTFDIPVVVTTIDEDSERAYRLGAHTFIQRPFLPEDVLEAVLEAEKESRRERILIIDDQEDTIRLLTHLLKEHSDFKIYSAQSGDEGISLVARRRPDLIILDLRMPGKDGFAVLDELRGNPETAKIPVLVVTGEMDLNTSEQEQLIDIHVLQKTDISQEEYDLFIQNVRSYLASNNRK